MDFSLSPRAAEFRTEVMAFLDSHLTGEVIDTMHRTGTFNDKHFNAAMADAGLLAGAVPGYGDRDPIELYVLFNELEKAGAPYDGLAVTMLVAGVINAVGTDFHREQVLDRLLTGRFNCCLGYSEPDHGSDVAAITTRAVQDGDEWVVNGQKMWTTMAHEADWVILLTRTDPDVPKHKGLTMFLVPMDTPGIEVQPVPTMASERTNATFYDEVRIGDEWRLGDVNGGWSVMGVALAFERGVMGGTNPAVPLLRHVRGWATDAPSPDGGNMIDDPLLRERIARTAIANQVSQLLTLRAAWIAATGGLPGLEGSMAKLYATDRYRQAVGWFQQMAGADGLLGFGTDGAAADGWIDYDARHSPVTTIYGGTTEINRNNVAERHLGLPRAR
ncbi:MAG: acyl-CoA dehydrogenase family protein [Actinomycetota bacterium]|jgi:alkylation response protein AidB-like acyl-CoA dehydrogenase|nr:acyl-CoA dehydrogenase family protein [Actinomycetota bacterium]MEE3211252.1 acyl-CoA dehydrogenase family protein [Actinomycetota bacterium]|tara:strand:+ start:3561 stop:4721 length:1161 start_codon:yes stop_codon:yes gene_type:complete